jgi:hypothetical protein
VYSAVGADGPEDLHSQVNRGRAHSVFVPSRRSFLRTAAVAASAHFASRFGSPGQIPGDRPARSPDVEVINPRARVPVGLIIDDSTCLVNLNRFAMPQFDQAFRGENPSYHLPWKEWPVEIPDSFVRKFGEWCASQGVKGKYSIVPYPACVGRLDREVPGWSRRDMEASIELVRSLMLPNWDIHPEMVTHTRVIDTKTGHPYPEYTTKFMENWEWATGRSTDEIADYLAYALRILKNIGLPCEGVTTPGGFASKARPQLAEATFQSVRDVFAAEIPHYFRDLFADGTKSVAPIVQNASGLDGPDPRCVVHVLGCTGDWTGGWDCTPPGGVDKFITEDLKSGRMVDVIERGEPAMMLAHWTGIYFNGAETGFKIFQEVVRRLQARYDHLHWMKLSELARYWAAKELTEIKRSGSSIEFRAPFACSEFTVRIGGAINTPPRLQSGDARSDLSEVPTERKLAPGTWCRSGSTAVACFALPKGASKLTWTAN